MQDAPAMECQKETFDDPFDAPGHWVSQNENQNWGASDRCCDVSISRKLEACLCQKSSR